MWSFLLVSSVSAAEYLKMQQPVEGSYLVKLKPQAGANGVEAHLKNVSATEGFDLRWQYSFLAEHGFPAYAANLTSSALQLLLNDPAVDYVEETGHASVFCDVNQGNPANWGISRISAQRDWVGSWSPSPTNPNPPYNYDKGASGQGVYAFVLDTGIECSNKDFTDSCLHGKSFVKNEPDDGDYQGHGTHCSSILGGTVYGVAKSVFLQPVKVMNMYGSGTYDDIIAGMDWSASAFPGSPGVLSMSIGGSASQAVNDAVSAVVKSGRLVVTASGNDNDDACGNSPGSSPDAFNVQSMDEKGARSDSSNFGPCTDIFAPGVLIKAAYRDGTSWLSGTSMACPHVAGAVAIALSRDPTLTPKQVKDHVMKVSTDGAVKGVDPTSPNKLLFADCA